MRFRRIATAALMAAPFVATMAVPALAHEEREVGGHQIVVGWLDEPAYAGFKNAVQFIASHGDGDPVNGANLEVEVVFGEAEADERSEPMPLDPAFGTPGEYHAFLIPTRPGTYTFHVFGTLGQGEEFDETFTSGEDTFDDIHEPTDAQFPAQDPTNGELSDAVTRLQTRLESAQGQVAQTQEALAAARSDSQAAEDTAGLARLLAIVALAVAVIGAAALVLGQRRRRASP